MKCKYKWYFRIRDEGVEIFYVVVVVGVDEFIVGVCAKGIFVLIVLYKKCVEKVNKFWKIFEEGL